MSLDRGSLASGFNALLVFSFCAVGMASLGSCTRRSQAVEEYVKALSAYQAGKIESASDGAKRALEADDHFLPALMLLGKTSYFIDDDTTAIKAFKKALAHTVRAGEAALWLARSYRAAGQVREAQSTCELLLVSNPVDIAALRLASQLAIDRNDVGSAKAYLDRAIESSAEVGLSFVDRAALQWASGNRDYALDDLKAALMTLPEGSIAFSGASALLVELAGATP